MSGITDQFELIEGPCLNFTTAGLRARGQTTDVYFYPIDTVLNLRLNFGDDVIL